MPKKKNSKRRAKATRPSVTLFSVIRPKLTEALFIVLVALSVFMLVALCSYHDKDPSWTYATSLSQPVHNSAGIVGAWIADLMLYLVGLVAFFFPPLLFYAGCQLFVNRHGNETPGARRQSAVVRCVGFIMIVTCASSLVALHYPMVGMVPYHPGGVLGLSMAGSIVHWFNVLGATCLLLALFIMGLLLFTGASFFDCLEKTGRAVTNASVIIYQTLSRLPVKERFLAMKAGFIEHQLSRQERQVERAKKLQRAAVTQPSIGSKNPVKRKKKDSRRSANQKDELNDEPIPSSLQKSVISPNVVPFSSKAGAEKGVVAHAVSKSYQIPCFSLLKKSKHRPDVSRTEQALHSQAHEVEKRLADFGVDASVTAILPGPVVTRFEIELAAGTKVSKVSNLAKDLARSLSVLSVRVVEVIPGKSVIGLELPNPTRQMVVLRDVLESDVYARSASKLSIALGHDISGQSVVVDLAKMPHLLVAGTTGSGKSVSLNTMLLSLLYKSTPDQLRMILIDPKMLELSVYEGIPHLLTPVVTDMRDAGKALRWCVSEMERRYHLMASLGVRNLAGYNEKVIAAKKKGNPLLDPMMDGRQGPAVELEPMPQIVVLADEFADMMVVVGKKVETLIARLAQKARAAGIHLILATQRPSVDVITGLIKANIPGRIAFQVSSKIDSRTILDQPGAEQLLGNGDMLYLPPGTGVPVRVHGAYVSDDEVHRVVKHLRETCPEASYDQTILEEAPESPPGAAAQTDWLSTIEKESGEKDALYDEAVEMVIQSRRVSVSSIQRRFKIGYNRAARIVDSMEEAGVVSAMESNGSREVLVPKRDHG